jgi:hypothetical protein
MKKPSRPAGKAAKPRRKPIMRQSRGGGNTPKSSFDLAMERLRAADRESGIEETPLSLAQKKEVAEARRVASSRLAEREILFADAMRKTADPAEREKAEGEYQIDRQRINDDCERAIEAIRSHTRRGAAER